MNIITEIYKKAGYLNAYVVLCNPKVERIHKELLEIDKKVKEALAITSSYLTEQEE